MAIANGLVLLLGALLIGIPIVLHLLMQPKPKLIPFPALRFVRQRQQSNRRQIQLRHWILLFLRCLLIAAIVLALAGISAASASFGSWVTFGIFAFVAALAILLFLATLLWTKPLNKLLLVLFGIIALLALSTSGYLGVAAFRNPSQQILGNRVAPVSAIVIVDCSPRMEYQNNNQSRLEKAVELAKWIIGQLPEDSQVSIAIPDGSEPFFSVDLSAAGKRLETLSIDYQATSLPLTIGPALRLFDEALNERREIYLVSDLTRPSWQRADTIKPLLEEHPEVSCYLIDVGVEQPSNAAIAPINISSEVISQSNKLQISSSIESIGDVKDGVAQLFLEEPDNSRPFRSNGTTMLPEKHIVRPQVIEFDAMGRAQLNFTIDDSLPPGIHHGWIEFDSGDGLKVDDRRYFTVEMRPAWEVLVVAPRTVSTTNLVEVISPKLFREAGTQEFNCRVIEQDKLASYSREQLDQFQLVVLLDPQPVGEGAWTLIGDFVQSGGGLAIFMGWNASANQQIADDFNSKAANVVMPGLIDARPWRRPRDESRFLVVNSSTHPVTRPFVEAASSIRWDLLQVDYHWGLSPNPDQDQSQLEVLFRYSNQLPAIVEKRVGLGRVVLMTTPISEPNNSPDRDRWNDLFFDLENCWPSFWLVQQISRHLVSTRPTRLNLELGEIASLDNDSDKFPEQYRLFTPRDEEPGKLVADQGQVRFRFTNSPGHFRLKGQMDGPVLRGFSVNLPPNATDLNRIDVERLDDWFGEGRIQIASDEEEIEREQGATRVGREFYPVLVTLLAILFGLELIMSNRFYSNAPSRTGNKTTTSNKADAAS